MKITLAGLALLSAAAGCGTAEECEKRTAFGPQTYAEVRAYKVRPTLEDKSIPEALRISPEEAARLNAKIAAEEAKIGYVPKEGPYHPGHWFGSWTKTYWDSHREYFGLCPNGERGVVAPGFPPWMKSLSKICVSNDETVRLRLRSGSAAANRSA